MSTTGYDTRSRSVPSARLALSEAMPLVKPLEEKALRNSWRRTRIRYRRRSFVCNTLYLSPACSIRRSFWETLICESKRLLPEGTRIRKHLAGFF
ncbi:hypothetical protein [Nostoc sp.]|uniref:hypothetical protein n=1 Tax=Nostoc sp. TaxID=1180 RepID=UPI002FFC30A1